MGLILKRIAGRSGYPLVNLTVDGVHKMCQIHALIAETFIGPVPAGKEINHIDADRDNPTPANLEYVTRQENAQHASRLGRLKKPPGAAAGEKNGYAKMSADDVREIRSLKAAGIVQRRIAERIGVSPATVSQVLTGKQWSHLP